MDKENMSSKKHVFDEIEVTFKRIFGLKKFEDAVNEVEEEVWLLKKSIEALSIGITVADLDGKILYTNSAEAEMHGYGAEEVVGRNVNIFMPDEFKDAKKPGIKEISEWEEWTREITEVKKDGTRFPVRLKSVPVKDSGGHPFCIITISEDITEGRRKEISSRQTRETLEAILESTPFGIIIVDRDKTIMNANKAAIELMGYESLSEIVGRTCHYTMCPAEANKCPILDLGQTLDKSEKILLTKDGRKIPILKTVVPVNFYGEELLLEAFVDITRRVKAEDNLKNSERFLQSVIDGIAEPIMIIDNDYRIKFLNQAAYEQSNVRDRPTESLCYKVSHRYDQPCSGIEHPCPLEKVRDSGRPVTVEHEHFSSGKKRIFEIISSPLFGADGSFQGIIEMSHDITRRKQMEKELVKSLNEKEMLIKEVHHRVKNNLAVITSLLRLQSSQIADKKSRKYFIDTENRVRAMSIIHEKLYKSEDLLSIDFDEYISDLAMQLFKNYNADSSRVRLDIDVSDIPLDIDIMIPCGLIINELLSNALKYAFPDDRKGRLSVSLTKGEDNTHTLAIKDNGVGLPEGLDIYETESLGMKIVMSLTSQIGGWLELSKEDGTEFRITFKGKRFQLP
jgi:PAS domain S-box-containing protein